MKIAIEGCAHGELDTIYDTIKFMEEKDGFKIDLLICCGDFQACRNEDDLRCMAVPPKFCKLCTFYKYYTGEKEAPYLTIFIGGNHEASNYLQELPYGGWVAPNIYYMGYASVINIAGLRIGGISGIFKGQDYMKGHYEHSPYSDSSKRSVYHIRNLEVFRLKQLTGEMDIFLSHDWPSGVWEHGDKNKLLQRKPFFEADIESGKLGSRPTEELLNALKPQFWFAAHLHCKFSAVIPHGDGKVTKFLSLDKCLPRRQFLQIVDIPHNNELKTEISYDLEWLTILRLTNHLLCVKNVTNYLPGPTSNERWCFQPTEEEKQATLDVFGDNLVIPNNFEQTAEGHSLSRKRKNMPPVSICNPQTVLFCKKLLIDDPLELLLNLSQSENSTSETVAESTWGENTFIDDSDSSFSSPNKNMSALNLPQPINDIGAFIDTEGDFSNGNESKQTKNFTSQQDEQEQEDKNVPVKMFKRRNAAMYREDS